MQLKKSFKKGCQFFAVPYGRGKQRQSESIEDHSVLKGFEDVFGEIP
jgi:hypothetical protein